MCPRAWPRSRGGCRAPRATQPAAGRARRRARRRRREQMLDREVLVTHVAAQLVGGIEALARGATEVGSDPRRRGPSGTAPGRCGCAAPRGPPQLGEDGPAMLSGWESTAATRWRGDLGVVGGGRLLVGGREGFSGLQRPSFGSSATTTSCGVFLGYCVGDRRLAEGDQVSAVLAVRALDGLSASARARASSARSRATSASSSRTCRTLRGCSLGGELLDPSQTVEVALGEAPAPASGARRVEQPAPLIDSKRLGVHAASSAATEIT